MELDIVRAGYRFCLLPDLVLVPHEGFGVVPDGARMVGYPGSVLVLNEAQFERVGLVQAEVVCCSACVYWFAMHGVWSGFGWLWQVELLLIGNQHNDVTCCIVY